MSEQWSGESRESIKETEHSILINGKSMEYSAFAGYIPLFLDESRKIGEMFFVSYKKKVRQNEEKRPVSFILDGGPGASSIMLHMNFFGPRQVAGTEKGIDLPEMPYRFADNENTLLTHSDLVFIDPVGTGFSRPEEGVDPYKTFWGVKQDIDSICQFIQRYMAQNRLFGSPLYLEGKATADSAAGHWHPHFRNGEFSRRASC